MEEKLIIKNIFYSEEITGDQSINSTSFSQLLISEENKGIVDDIKQEVPYEYYYSHLIIFTIILVVIESFINYIKYKNSLENKKEIEAKKDEIEIIEKALILAEEDNNNINHNINNKDDNNNSTHNNRFKSSSNIYKGLKSHEINEELKDHGNKLKLKFIIAYLFARAAMWAKSPYIYLLFSTLHGFTLSEISVLYLIDAVLNIFSGPIIGILADTIGRKTVSSFAPLNTMITIALRLTGNRPLAYLSQIITGLLGSCMSTAFEAWLNYEISDLFKNNDKMKVAFRKNIFSR